MILKEVLNINNNRKKTLVMGLESTPQESASLLKMLKSLSCKKLTCIFSFTENFRNVVGHLMPR